MWPQIGHLMKWSASLLGVQPTGLPGFFGGGVALARRPHRRHALCGRAMVAALFALVALPI
jgi:hypothetical protein